MAKRNESMPTLPEGWAEAGPGRIAVGGGCFLVRKAVKRGRAKEARVSLYLETPKGSVPLRLFGTVARVRDAAIGAGLRTYADLNRAMPSGIAESVTAAETEDLSI